MKTIDLTSRMTLKPASLELVTDYVSGELPLGQSIGGSQVFSDSLIRGYGDNVFGQSSKGIWMGAADFSNAPFRFDMSGNGYIGGSVTIGNGVTIQSGNTSLVSIINGTVTATYINALNVQAATVKSDWVYAGNIQASQVTTGTMSADRISGGTLILGGNSNGNGVMRIKNSSGNDGLYADNGGLIFYDDRFSSIIWTSSGNTPHGYIGYESSAFVVGSYNGVDTDILSDGNVYITATSTNKDIGITAYRNVNLTSNNQDINLTASHKVYLNSGNGYAIDINASGDINMSPGTGKKVVFNKNINMNQNGIDNCYDIYCHNVNGNSFNFSGTKSAIVETSQGWKAVYSSEAPDVWFFDFCETKESIDPMFLEITEGPMKFIQCDDGTYQVWRRRKGYGSTRFEDRPQPISQDN